MCVIHKCLEAQTDHKLKELQGWLKGKEKPSRLPEKLKKAREWPESKRRRKDEKLAQKRAAWQAIEKVCFRDDDPGAGYTPSSSSRKKAEKDDKQTPRVALLCFSVLVRFRFLELGQHPRQAGAVHLRAGEPSRHCSQQRPEVNGMNDFCADGCRPVHGLYHNNVLERAISHTEIRQERRHAA